MITKHAGYYLYLNYHSAYGHLTWQDGDLPWQTPTHKATWPFDHLVLQNHVTNWTHFMDAFIKTDD